MWRELLVSCGTSAVVGAAGFAYDRYAYWSGWTPGRFVVGLLLFAAGNATGAALVLALSSWLNWEPRAGAWAYNGFVYGLIAQGLVRVEPRVRDLRTIEHGRSVLAAAQRFVEHFLDRGVRRAVGHELHGLDGPRLFDEAIYLLERHVDPDQAVPRSTKVRLRKQLNDAGALLKDGPEGRGTLEAFIVAETERRNLHRDEVWMPGLPVT